MNCAGSPRTSQIPASGRRQIRQTRSAISARRRPWSAVEAAGEAAEQRRRGQHLAVDVELQLRSGAVADAHRRRATVAGERQLSLMGVVAAVQAVEHLDARMRQLRGMKQPPEERPSLAPAAEREQRLEREGGIARPREAVVPVAPAADLLRQRGRGCRRDRPRRREDEQLQRKRAAQDRFTPRPVVGALARPGAPARDGGVEPRLDVVARAGGRAALGVRRSRRAGCSDRHGCGSDLRPRRRRSRPGPRPRSGPRGRHCRARRPGCRRGG